MKALIWFTLIAFSAVFSLASSDVDHSYPITLSSEISLNFAPNKLLQKQEISQDIDYLTFAIKNSYSGFKFSIDNGIKNFLYALETIELDKTSSIDFCLKLNPLMNMVSDSHFKLFFDQKCLQNSHERMSSDIGNNFGKNDKSIWEENFYTVDEKNIPVLSIHRFDPANDLGWSGLSERLIAIRETKNDFIIDLRHNSGGYDGKAQEIFSIMTDYPSQWVITVQVFS